MPLGMPSLGAARRHGASTDHVGGVGALGRWYFGPAAQPAISSNKQKTAAIFNLLADPTEILRIKITAQNHCVKRAHYRPITILYFDVAARASGLLFLLDNKYRLKPLLGSGQLVSPAHLQRE